MIHVIARWFVSGGPSNNAQKRHAGEVLPVVHGGRNCESNKRRPPPLIFDDKSIDISVVPDHDDPLLVKAFINNKLQHRQWRRMHTFLDARRPKQKRQHRPLKKNAMFIKTSRSLERARGRRSYWYLRLLLQFRNSECKRTQKDIVWPRRRALGMNSRH